MSAVRRLGVTLVVVMLLVDLASCRSHATHSVSNSAPPAVRVVPTSLIGTWTVVGNGIESGTRIAFASDVTIYRQCGASTGTWLGAQDGTMLIAMTQVPQTCVAATAGGANAAFALPWLTHVAAVTGFPEAPTLVDGSGTTLASLLRPSSSPPPPAWFRTPSNVVPDVPTSGLRRVDPASLMGTWLLDSGRTDAGAVTFKADGTWSSPQSCGTLGGRWAPSSSTPSVLLVPDLKGQLDCHAGPAVTPLVGGVTVGFDAGRLVVVDRSGHVAARYTRAP